MTDALEIERKFLVDGVPEAVVGCEGIPILQGYLADAGEAEVRLRVKGEAYYLTVKSGAGLVRQEREVELSRTQFEVLWPATEGYRIEKTRYGVPAGPATVEVDVYAGPLLGLVTAEVEFSTEQDAAEFDPPGWIGAEITEDTRYSNRNLARWGRPNY